MFRPLLFLLQINACSLTWAAELSAKANEPKRIPACGVASVYCELKLLGHSVRLDELEKRFHAECGDASLSVLSFHDLRRVLGSYGFNTSAVRFAPHEIRSVPRPSILYFRTAGQRAAGLAGHFAVLESVGTDSATLLDLSLPESLPNGRATVPLRVLGRGWGGETLLVWRGPRTLWQKTLFALPLLGTAALSAIALCLSVPLLWRRARGATI